MLIASTTFSHLKLMIQKSYESPAQESTRHFGINEINIVELNLKRTEAGRIANPQLLMGQTFVLAVCVVFVLFSKLC